MADADVLVMTSRHEGFGVPVVEAMTLGLPVVVNHAGALPEVVGDGGLLVDADRPVGAGRRRDAVRREDGLRRRFVEAAARRVTELDLASAGERAVDLWSR